MNVSTLVGLTLGLVILVVSLLIGGVPVQTLLQPEAVLIVFGGTLTALLVNFSMPEIQNAMGMCGSALREDDVNAEEVADYLYDASVYIRSKGLLAVQPLLSHVEIPFLQKGLQMIVDNHAPELIRTQLTTEMEVAYRADLQCARIFETAGGFAPTMGIIGAIVGLVQVMGMLGSPEQLGHGVAGAFIATLYGVGIANLFLLPLAGKLKERAKDHWVLKSMMLQGLLAIREEQNPALIRDQLDAYLQPVLKETPQPEALPAYAYETPVGV